MTTIVQAVDDIYGRFKTAWDTVGHAAIYQDVPLDTLAKAAIDTGSVSWARLNLKHNLREQGTLAGPLGSRYDVEGVLIVEIYTPSGDGGALSRTLSRLVERAYEGISSLNGVWFRKVRTNEVGPDGHWYHVNVIVEFQYDELPG